jgi:hypothetical protein
MKKLKNLLLTFLLLVLAVLIYSCSKEDTSLARTGIVFKAVSNQHSLGNARSEGYSITFLEVLIGVTEIELESEEENESEHDGDFEDEDHDGEDDNEKVEFEGSFIVDVINGTSTPDFGLAQLAEGVYEEIEIELGPVLEGGNTVFVAFSFTPDGGDPITVEYSNNYELEFEVESESGFTIENGLSSILILFDLDALMQGVDLSLAEADQDGVIRINSSSNADIAEVLESNFASILSAGNDDDHDGEFDDEKDDDDHD